MDAYQGAEQELHDAKRRAAKLREEITKIANELKAAADNDAFSMKPGSTCIALALDLALAGEKYRATQNTCDMLQYILRANESEFAPPAKT